MTNLPGWRTERKLVILESDDWGSIRMPSREVYEILLKSGDKVDSDPFTRYDALESEGDLSLLFECLTKYKDWKGNHPVITANCAVANPDFAKIEASGYREFHYEPFTETLKRYPHHQRSFELWQQGIQQKVFFPQLHCREHMNSTRWLKHLQEGRSDLVTAFKHRMISTGDSFTPVNKYAYMDAFNYDLEEEFVTMQATLKEGAELFKQIFGYPSKSFIAPCYIWSAEFEQEIASHEIQYLQGSRVQLIPRETEGTKKLGSKWHYIGQVNRYNQLYLLRNCVFEPSWRQNINWVDNCLWEVAIAFRWNKPATISTHRLNYIGYIDESNRDKNLKLLAVLLAKIMEQWPEVEFITSVELGEIIREG
ncbi:MAG: hypothetical protein P4L59_18595 [Desulfosporosinus sp.]|nr:hypothetical protein [Desulfosporosinus sp.]